MRLFLGFILLTFCVYTLDGQQRYEFNRLGSECNLKYLVYNVMQDKMAYKRPFVFVVGKPHETIDRTFMDDTLRTLPQFYGYTFVYVPNEGGTIQDKVSCLPAMVSWLTQGYKSRNNNVFLFIKDQGVSTADIQMMQESMVSFKNAFRSAVLAADIVPSNTSGLLESFKATSVEEEAEKEVGNFYIDENADDPADPGISSIGTVKSYFGPPSSYNYTLSGMIRDRSSGEALPFATILVKGSSIATQSNVDGYFTLFKVPTDTSTLVISYIGYANEEVFLTPTLPKQNFVVLLSPASALLKTVTIAATKEDVVISKREDISVIKMTPKKLEQLPNLGERDIMRSFQLMPGVSASNESSSGLYVRGGTPDQNLVLYDGFTVYQVDHLYGFYSAFNANALKDVQLYKGGFESRFGGRLSSVTEITAKDGNQKKFNYGTDISLLSLNVWAEIPMGEKISSIITFRKSYKGPLYNKIFDKFNSDNTSSMVTQTPGGPGGGRFTQNTKVTSYFYDVNGKFTYRPTAKDVVSLSIFNGTDKLDNSIDNGDLPSFGDFTPSFSFSATDLTQYGNFGTSLKWSRKWSPKLYGNTLVSYSNFFSNRDRSQEMIRTNSSGESTTTNNGIFENNNLKDVSIKSDYQWDVGSFSQVQFGAYATQYDIKYTYAQNDTATVLDRHDRSFLGGGYLQSRTKFFKDKLHLLPGIRLSYYEQSDKVYYEPRASLNYSIDDRFTLKGAIGKYYQFANRVTREDILSGSKEFWLLSDGDAVPVSSAIHYIAGISYETNQWVVSTEAYYKTIHGLTEYSLRFNPSPQGVSYQENFYSGNGYARGIEFLLQRKLGNLNGWISYTLGEARNHFDVYSTDYFPANQDVRHEFKIVGLYKLKRWDFSASWVYASGRPYTAPSGAYTVTLLDGNTADYFTVTSKNSVRLPDYHRMDLSVNYKLLAGIQGDHKRREIGYIGFSIFNVYNRTNLWYKQYTIEDLQIVETNINYLGFTPNITLSLKHW
ncbi:MAG: TonB-dependent receptor [Saprospiraceae bacterium]|nr:TonB-dependent receptor [Candidatus Opimibacter iunctus]